jgi:hypothetical protein
MAFFASPGDTCKRKREWTQGQLNLGVYLKIVEKKSYLKAAFASEMPLTTPKDYVSRLKDESTVRQLCSRAYLFRKRCVWEVELHYSQELKLN